MRAADPGALVTSVVLHALLLGVGAWLLSRSLGADSQDAGAPPKLVEVAVEPAPAMELPRMSAAGLHGRSDPKALPEPRPAEPGGGERVVRPDQGRTGLGGTDAASETALNLADSVDGLTLDRDPMNRLDRSQVQRIKTAAERRSLDDRRATPNPMQLDFLATGPGDRPLRRPPSNWDPSAGVMSGTRPSERGGELGGPAVDDGLGPLPEPGDANPGTDRKRSARGVPDGALGRDVRLSARVALARPWVPRARAAVPAPVRGRPNDTVDSSQEVASAVRSLIHASTAGGVAGKGPGGQAAEGSPGSGGVTGPGSRSTPAGNGPGSLRDRNGDPRLTGYFRGIEKKVEWRDAFPDWAIAEGRGGMAVLALTLSRDGTLSAVRVVRPSGIPEFDRNVIAAVRRAAPFGRLPAVLGRGPLTLHMSFDALNPAVGRDGAGRGGRKQP
ncbi:MAG: TonB family protein [Myxococcales bacterium]|nr:TonB family protein [Myxococcales bacterium]MCB9576734.1 TonB family protein [Polyangiaceae bacterium]